MVTGCPGPLRHKGKVQSACMHWHGPPLYMASTSQSEMLGVAVAHHTGQGRYLRALVGKGAEGVDDEARGGAVEHVDGRGAHPRLLATHIHTSLLQHA